MLPYIIQQALWICDVFGAQKETKIISRDSIQLTVSEWSKIFIIWISLDCNIVKEETKLASYNKDYIFTLYFSLICIFSTGYFPVCFYTSALLYTWSSVFTLLKHIINRWNPKNRSLRTRRRPMHEVRELEWSWYSLMFSTYSCIND